LSQFDPTKTVRKLEEFNTEIKKFSDRLGVLRKEELEIYKRKIDIEALYHETEFSKVALEEISMSQYERGLKHATRIADIELKEKKVRINGIKEQLDRVNSENINYRLILKIESRL
jgi:hypothetical protein